MTKLTLLDTIRERWDLWWKSKHIERFPTKAVGRVHLCACTVEVCCPSCAFQPERQQETTALGMQVTSAFREIYFITS